MELTQLRNGVAAEHSDDEGWSVFGGPTLTFLGHADSLEQAQLMITDFGTPDADVIDEARIS